MIAFLDASALIYLVDGEAPWAEATQATLRQLAVQAADLAGLRTPDALQAACCLQLGPEAVMITGDAGFQRIQALQVRLIACS